MYRGTYLQKGIIGITLVILFTSASSYHSCIGFYKTYQCRIPEEKNFKQYGMVKSDQVKVAEPYVYQVILYGKKDYKIGVCTENGYAPVHFRLINAKTKKVIYDNMEDDYVETIGLTIENTSDVILEITVINKKQKRTKEHNNIICLGVQIIWSKVPKLGFH